MGGRRLWDGCGAILALIALVPGCIGIVMLRMGHIIGPALGLDTLTRLQVFLYLYLPLFGPAFAVTLLFLALSVFDKPPGICVDNQSGVDLTVVVEAVPDDHECRRIAVPAGTAVRRVLSRESAELSVGTAAVAYTAEGTEVARMDEPLWVSQCWVIGKTEENFHAHLRSQAG